MTMVERIQKIIESINHIEEVEITSPFEKDGDVIIGSVAVSVDHVRLNFAVKIFPQYPMQFQEQETIKFFNSELLSYKHVNADGSICVHTLHCPVLETKIQFDFNALQNWVKKYYINREKDSHYEHIVVPQASLNGIQATFLFTDVDYKFLKGQFGFFTYSNISDWSSDSVSRITNIVQEYKINKEVISCKWSKIYRGFAKKEGIFYYSEMPPVTNGRFAFKNWMHLEPIVSQEFFAFLTKIQRRAYDVNELPLLIGYKIAEGEIHWQTILIPVNQFPNYGQQLVDKSYWIGRFRDQEIFWAQTKNCSYSCFFGRGAFSRNLTESKILVIGIGAVGSQVATTLTRGGCRNMCLSDYQLKEAGNVCRSEYKFSSGILKKVDDLGNTLVSISPFIEITLSDKLTDVTKYFANDPSSFLELQKGFDEFDIIFDCTADNDVAYLLDQFDIRAQIFNLSITNHAKELVCAVKPNVYKWAIEIFEKLNSSDDLYNPTGCWSPTFKASYNEIAVLVQYAMKQISSCLQKEVPVRSFYLSTNAENEFSIKLHQY